MTQSTQRIVRSQSALVVVDIQERLLPAIFEKERVVQNALRLTRGAGILGVPILVTEQYRKGLGPTVPELAAVIAGFAPVEKLTFSACGTPGVVEPLKARRLTDVVLCGIEAHVCVGQTCLDLLAQDFRVFVVADAVSSRTAANWHLAMDRMRGAGGILVSTEMVLFEWLERAGTDDFKQVVALVK